MIKPSQISKKKTETVRQKKRQALDDQTKSDLQQKIPNKRQTKTEKLYMTKQSLTYGKKIPNKRQKKKSYPS
jgi:hypothetical protein